MQPGTADYRTVLNINVPNRPKDEIKGLKYTRLGDRKYIEIFVPLDEGEEVKVPGSFQYSGNPVHYEGLPEDLDVIANQDGYASITPIHRDLTHHGMIETIREWNLG